MAGFRSILAPVVNDAASLEAVAVGASLARQTKGRLTLLHVIEVERSLPVAADIGLEAQSGEALLRRACAIAEREGGGFVLEDDLLQARAAGATIVAEAKSRGVDVILLGVSSTPLLGHFELGPTASYVLAHASCAVWIVRERMEASPSTITSTSAGWQAGARR